MAIVEFLGSFAERLRGSTGVETVYGKPVRAGDKVILPVASVHYAMGGGFGREQSDESGSELDEGGGGGGAVRAVPVGVVEVTAGETRFVPIDLGRKLLGAALIGFALGALLNRR